MIRLVELELRRCSNYGIVCVLLRSIEAIDGPRFYQTERGYAGALAVELANRLPEANVMDGSIVEMEYQKRARLHGTRIRPDILVHVPTLDDGDRRVGNVMACELKLRARRSDAMSDFRKLDDLCGKLAYPVVAFINVDSNNTYEEFYNGPYRECFHFFATQLHDGRPHVIHVAGR
jgi:hypothetical protein